MYKFKNDFKEITPGEGYDGAMNLINGDRPLIYEIEKGDTQVSVIVSGTGVNETLLCILINSYDREGEYICSVYEYSTVAKISADYMVDRLLESRDLMETVNVLVAEFNMTNSMEVSHV